MRLLFLFLSISGILLRGNPPDKEFTSPDEKWAIECHSIGKGYVYQVENLNSHKTFLNGEVVGDEILPARLDAIWSPDSHYVAVTEYYGRAMQKLVVIAMRGGQPRGIDLHLNSPHVPLELTLLHPEDLPKYNGYNRLLTGGESWLNATDLIVGIDARIFLKDKKTGAASILDTNWQKTIRCTDTGGVEMASECQDYSLEDSSP